MARTGIARPQKNEEKAEKRTTKKRHDSTQRKGNTDACLRYVSRSTPGAPGGHRVSAAPDEND
eukprot:scaffold116301_cov19-Tisochrysis_lutea.AAC.1